MNDFIKKFREKYWIRKDREDLFFVGFMITCMVASVVTTYWHYFDMIEMKPKIKLKTEEKSKKEIKKLEEVGYMINLKKNSTFYKIDDDTITPPPLTEEGIK